MLSNSGKYITKVALGKRWLIGRCRAGKSRGTGEPRFLENFGKSVNLTENVQIFLDISRKILWNLGHLTENFSIFVKNFMLLFDFIFNIYW